MSDYLLERGLYATMAAVLIVPEPATFLIVLGFAASLVILSCRFAWALLADAEF